MNLDRLRKIIAYSESNRDSIHTRVKNFCSFVSLETDSPVLNILQIARSAFEKKDTSYLKYLLKTMKLELSVIREQVLGMLF